MKSNCIVAFACWIVLLAGSAHSQDGDELTRSQLQAKLEQKERELKDLESLRRAGVYRSESATQLRQAQPATIFRATGQQQGNFPAPLTRTFASGSLANLSGLNVRYFDPQIAKVNNEINQEISALVTQIKESETDDEKQELKNEINQLLEKQYDGYLEQHEAPLKKLEERLEKLRTDLEARRKAKEDLVKLKLDSIWYDALGLRWPGNSGGNRTLWGTSNYAAPAQIRSPRNPFAESEARPTNSGR